MSRSYKKTPYAGQKKCKFSKNYSNKKIRQAEIQRVKIADGGAFKKILDPWDICDFHGVETWKEFKRDIEEDFIAYHTKNHHGSHFSRYRWEHYCRRFKLDPYIIDWKKVKWTWYKMYKNK